MAINYKVFFIQIYHTASVGLVVECISSNIWSWEARDHWSAWLENHFAMATLVCWQYRKLSYLIVSDSGYCYNEDLVSIYIDKDEITESCNKSI